VFVKRRGSTKQTKKNRHLKGKWVGGHAYLHGGPARMVLTNCVLTSNMPFQRHGIQ